MYHVPKFPVINANGCRINNDTVQKTVMLSGLTWGMPLAQVCAMQLHSLINPVELKTEINGTYTNATCSNLILEPHILNMCGIPVELDKDLPDGVVQLRWKGAVLYTIESLAIPSHMETE